METESQESISALVSSAITDTQTLVKQQIDLTKAELSASAKSAAAASGLLIGAAVLGFLAFVLLLVAAAYGLVAAGLPEWAGFLIVAAVLLLIAAVLGLVAKKQSAGVTGPDRAIAQAELTKAALAGVTSGSRATTSPS